jgi:cytochrome bd ubiquinol oxidase subunit I
MLPLTLARLQFAITTVYHFFFVPLTLGLSILVAIMETNYVRTGDERWRRMTKFWGKLFLINFAMGVVTGIVQEFQFGMNWSEYSRYVGDIFGAPLAIEALLAFFLESTFLGIWIFGWDRLSKRLHAGVMWLVAIGSNLSALWILIANSWMQNPVGYTIVNGRAVMTDFGALVTNPHVWLQWPHVFFSGLATAGFFVLGIAAYRLWRRDRDSEAFQKSFRLAAVVAIIGAVMVGLIGHQQAQYMVRTQPMKMAAAEALYNSEDPAGLSLLTITKPGTQDLLVDIRIPGMLSLLSYNRLTGEVKGINQLQAQYEAQYGAGNYVPIVPITYWSFRVMVGAGVLMIVLAAWALILVLRKRFTPGFFLRWLPLAIALPYLANSAGWLLTELGRQPWIVVGLMKTEQGVSVAVSSTEVALSFVAYTLVYAALIVANVYLLAKYAKADTAEPVSTAEPSLAY